MQVLLPQEPKRSADGVGSDLDIGLRASSLRKAFPSPNGKTIEVLRNVSFSVAAGEIIAVMGASGAGKSTLLHLLGGLETLDSGTIQSGQLEGTAAEAHLPYERVSFVFQFHYLLADLTAVENVALPLMIARLSRNESLRRATRALEQIGLGDRLTHGIRYLSGGEQQRVAVARALITEPQLVLADEPTGNLDTSIAEEIGTLLVNYCRQKPAIVIIATHNERLAQLCDRVLLLRDGLLAGA